MAGRDGDVLLSSLDYGRGFGLSGEAATFYLLLSALLSLFTLPP